MDCLNITLNNSEPSKFNITGECALFDFVMYTIGMGSLCILGLVGNIVSFTILWRDQSKGATTFLLRALAIADSLVLIAVVPLYVLPVIYPYTHTAKSYYDLYMIILPYLWPLYHIPYTATIMLTVLVSLNRYMAVCKPYKSNHMCSLGQAKFHVLYIALFSVLYNIPRFFEYETTFECVGYNKSKQQGFGVSAFGENKYYRIIYANIMYFVLMHGGPLVMLSFLNVNLIKALKQRQKKRMEMGKGGYQQDITLVLVVVVFVFICCQTPTFIDHVLWTFVDPAQRTCGHWLYYYTAVGDTLAVLNSSVNFVIYILTSRKFRHSLLMACPGGEELLRLPPASRAEMTVLTQAPTGNGVRDKD